MARRKGREHRGESADALPGPPLGSSESRAPRSSTRWIIVAVLAAVVALAVYWGYTRTRSIDRTASLPALPELSKEPPVLRAHLTEADGAVRTQPASVDAVAALCLAYHADMFYEQARQCYALAEEMDGASWRWVYLQALAQGEAANSEALVDGLRRVTNLAPDFSPAWWRLGDAEFKARRYDRAAEAWQRVLSLPAPAPASPPPANAGSPGRVPVAPMAAYAILGLARLALIQGDADRARAMLEDVTASAPRFGPAFRLLGDAYSVLKRPEEAARAIRRADRSPAYDPYVDPTMETLVLASRNATFLLQQAASSDVSTNGVWREFLIRRALEFDPTNTDALSELGTLLRVLQRYEEALEQFEGYRRLVPDDVQVFIDIGRCLTGLGRFAEAEQALRRALEDFDDGNTRYALALALDRSGRLAEAVVEYRRALERNPNHGDALNNLGVAFVRQGQLDLAARQFERLVAADPDNADAHTNLGVVFLTQGARDLASREFKAALSLSPDHALARQGLKKVEQ